MKKIKLFNEETISILMKSLSEMKTNKARLFQEERIERIPHCNVFTSMARLISAREVCGCIKISKEKNGTINQLYLTTNKISKDGIYRKKIVKLIVDLVRENFADDAKLNLYKAISELIIQKLTKDDLESLEESEWLGDKDLLLTKDLVINLSNQESNLEKINNNWKNISIDRISLLKNELKKFLEKSDLWKEKRIEIAKIRNNFWKSLVFLNDAEKICEDLSNVKGIELIETEHFERL
jgi:hypothetical protein